MQLLADKVAVVTGAGGGIGRAHALALAAHGARVVVNDVGQRRDGTGEATEMAAEVVAEIVAAGGEAVSDASNIADAAGAQAVVDLAVATYGQLDILINNAGILRDKTLVKMTDDMWRAVIEVHLTGTFLCSRAAAQQMIAAQRGGRIINTSSISGLLGNFGQANYAAAKAGIYGFTRTIAQELARHRITVNALAPIALTRMTEDLSAMQERAATTGLDPQHVATAAVFLASPLADEITGAILSVEGAELSLYRMTRTAPRQPKDGQQWTPAEIAARWGELAETRPE